MSGRDRDGGCALSVLGAFGARWSRRIRTGCYARAKARIRLRGRIWAQTMDLRAYIEYERLENRVGSSIWAMIYAEHMKANVLDYQM